jgi:hypothetical protein
LKKSAAILFSTLFLFNLIGYKCWFHYLQQKDQHFFEASLDKDDYNEKDLITFKIPLSMPYQTGWRDFERVDGEATIDGVIYKYVKRKVEDGQLILQCIPYYKKMRLTKAAAEFGNHGNDLIPVGKKAHGASSIRNNSPNEYEENSRCLLNFPTKTLTTLPALFRLSRLRDGFPEFLGRPPQLS